MVVINRTCTTCNNEFELHFRYQMEEHAERDDQGVAQTRHTFYCSQRCLEASHRGRTDGAVPCDACATRFEVELASQVLFTGGRRHYACSPECRTRILSGVRSVRLGQLLDPAYPIENDERQASDAASSRCQPVRAAPAPCEPTPAAPLRRAEQRREPAPPASPTPARRREALRRRRWRPSPSCARPRNRRKFRMRGRSAATPKVLAVFNHKGGTGKTTTAVHVAAGLAARGAKVLLGRCRRPGQRRGLARSGGRALALSRARDGLALRAGAHRGAPELGRDRGQRDAGCGRAVHRRPAQSRPRDGFALGTRARDLRLRDRRLLAEPLALEPERVGARRTPCCARWLATTCP